MTVKTRLLSLSDAAQRLRMTEGDLKKVFKLCNFSVFEGRNGPVLGPGDLLNLKSKVRSDPKLYHLSAPAEMEWIGASLVAWVEADRLTLKSESDQLVIEYLGDCS